MNVLIYSPGQDTAGQGYRMKRAVERAQPTWNVRSTHATPTYMRYPEDLRADPGALTRLFREADLAHLRTSIAGFLKYDAGRGRPAVLHHHGTRFRTKHQQVSAEAQQLGIRQLVSTMDLELLEPDLTWIPTPYDLDELSRIRLAAAGRHAAQEKIRIVHAPTSRAVKSTDLVIATVEALAERYPVELDLIEQRPWEECLARKALADIFVDQLQLGYGCNAVEAWAMGIPVIAGVADPRVRSHMLGRLGRLPFYEASEQTLAQRLEELLREPALREEYGQVGLEYVRTWHDERVVGRQLSEIYQRQPPVILPSRVPPGLRPAQPVRRPPLMTGFRPVRRPVATGIGG